jgi:predicted NAD/FAD-binding protein
VRALILASRFHAVIETPVLALSRCGDGVELRLGDGDTRSYDRAVLACHADEALSLLSDASAEETAALGRFSYVPNRVVLHSDERLLPKRPAARASWNYVTGDCRAEGPQLTLTYHLNRLQALDAGREFCVTVNPPAGSGSARIGGWVVDPALVHHEAEFSHPRYTFETLEGQRALSAINGRCNTFFAGAYLGYGFHEDGYASGRAVAEALGVCT